MVVGVGFAPLAREAAQEAKVEVLPRVKAEGKVE